jgi:sec-independent protein translocase protein TatC
MSATPLRRAPEREPGGDAALDGRMGFLEHLEELRRRVIHAAIAIAAGMLVAFAFVYPISDFLLQPTFRALPPGAELTYFRPGEGFSFYFDVAFICGFVLAAPYVAFQVWRFVAPGLYAREKKLVVPFVVLASVGTIGGAAFSHYVMFPSMMKFFAAFSSPRMHFVPRVEDTFDLYKSLLLGMVAVFQIPTIVLFLARMQLVTARFLWRHVRLAILIIFIAAAVLTPSPDPWNQTAFALPMIALYLIGIVVAWVVQPRGSEPRTRVSDTAKLRLVVGAMALERAARRSPSNRV